MVEPKTRQAIAIDASESEALLKLIDELDLKLSHILCTHHHWDHVSGNIEVQKVSNCEIWCSEWDFNSQASSRVPGATRGLSDRENFTFFGHHFVSIFGPGHTQGAQTIYSDSLQIAFTGDSLFNLGCGRLLEGSAEQMFRTLQGLKELPSTTQFFCGHEYTYKNLQFALSKNPSHPLLRKYELQVKTTYEQHKPTVPGLLSLEFELNPFLLTKNISEFTALRLERDQF